MEIQKMNNYKKNIRDSMRNQLFALLIVKKR